MGGAAGGSPPDHARLVQRQFGPAAAGYVTGDHRAGADLDLIAAWAAEALARLPPPGADPGGHGFRAALALDVATGGGHTALRLARAARGAPGGARVRVAALDLTGAMLVEARGFLEASGVDDVALLRGDAAALPLAPASAWLVACRIAPHHFASPARFCAEAARVLRPGGRLIVEDSVVPDDPRLDRMMNDLERARDPSHVRSLTGRAWEQCVAGAGLALLRTQAHAKRHDFGAWTRLMGHDETARRRLEKMVLAWPAAAKACFRVEVQGDRVASYTDEKRLLLAEKQPPPR